MWIPNRGSLIRAARRLPQSAQRATEAFVGFDRLCALCYSVLNCLNMYIYILTHMQNKRNTELKVFMCIYIYIYKYLGLAAALMLDPCPWNLQAGLTAAHLNPVSPHRVGAQVHQCFRKARSAADRRQARQQRGGPLRGRDLLSTDRIHLLQSSLKAGGPTSHT